MRSGIVLLALGASLAAAPPAAFREHVIATGLRGGYQVIPYDLDRDGDTDLIALASGMKELYWFENPGWERRLLAEGFSRLINLAACGSDGRGRPLIVLAQGFSNEASKSTGEVLRLEAGEDVTAPWKATEIDRLPTSHRIRCADIDGSGRPVFVNVPLTGAGASGPEFRGHTPLVLYRPGVWRRELIGEENEGVVHGVEVLDWDGDGRDEILTASFSGIHLYDRRGDRWTRREIARGDPSPWPRCGASDVTVGRLGKRRIVASIEPWHGHQLAVYTERSGAWRRNVVDTSLKDGHTVAAADLNGDGLDEVIAGFRGEGRSVFVFHALDREGRGWRKEILDNGGMAAASCAVLDLNGDRRPDITCIGSASANLKWYENLGAVPAGAQGGGK